MKLPDDAIKIAIICLRGCSENININNKYITSILNQIKNLNLGFSITFTGGEPTLNLKAIEHYLKECERLNISHKYFYIATNGNKLDFDFALICMKLYATSSEKEICQVQLSNDLQHEYIEEREKEIFNALKFFQDKHDTQFDYFNKRSGAVNQGNYAEYANDGRDLKVYDFGDFEEWEDHEIYLNAKGNLINGCDWSYKNQDNNEDLFISKVDDFTQWYNTNVVKECLV